eukprot:TRINITY_DN11343_c0_g1_i2.p2 TRINITY_DN11343_c0_g1~~TRINITY_DN11343_c0_g1_i2.p2  ORF type:complete len:119 (-),score=36.24 TRINITY_DN11343_c0_g1_i2:40-354(-)
MLRSLVGSEMCIRDSINAEYGYQRRVRGARIRHMLVSAAVGTATIQWLLRRRSHCKSMSEQEILKVLACADGDSATRLVAMVQLSIRLKAVSYTHLTLPTKRIV